MGGVFCIGGTGKIIGELKKLMKRQKIKILTNVNITDVEVINHKIVSLKSDKNEMFECDKLVFNGDPPVFYNEILKSKKFFSKKNFSLNF